MSQSAVSGKCGRGCSVAATGTTGTRSASSPARGEVMSAKEVTAAANLHRVSYSSGEPADRRLLEAGRKQVIAAAQELSQVLVRMVHPVRERRGGGGQRRMADRLRHEMAGIAAQSARG